MSTQNLTIVPLLDPEHDPGDTTTNAHMSSNSSSKMKAVHYEGPFKVSVKEVDVPKIEHPDDAIIKVTTAGTMPCIKRSAVKLIDLKLSVAPTCTCIKDELPQKKV